MAHMKMISIKIGQSYVVGMSVIASIVRHVGKIEVMRENVMIAVAI